MSQPTIDPQTATRLHASVIAQRVHDITWADVPDTVRAVAKEHLLDAIGLALAATRMDFGDAIHRAGVALGDGTASHVIGFGSALSAPNAALVNGTLMHGLDFDDTHVGAIYHATGPALAAALAVGEAEGASGEDVLLAYILGLEVGCRLAAAGAGRFHQRGFHPTGIIGTFAAAAVAGKLRGLSVAELTSALGLCGSQAAGVLELHESWLKRMHPGWAAHAGIIATTMAAAGFRGPASIFEGAGGLFQSHLGYVPDAEALGLADLGERWMTTEIALKPYPCCHFTHAFIDGAAGALDDLGVLTLSADEIESIETPIHPMLIPMVCEPVERKIAPTTIYDALFSVPFVVAQRLTGGSLDLATFYDSPLDDPDVLAVAALVRHRPDPSAPFPRRFPGEIIVTLKDGRTAHRVVESSHGTPGDLLAHAEVIAKFEMTAGRVMDAGQVAGLIALVDDLEHAATISELVAATRASDIGGAISAS